MTPEQYSLDYLIEPVTSTEFFEKYWESRTLFVSREQPDYYSGLLTFDDVQRVVTTLSLGVDDISMTQAGRSITPDMYAYPSGMIDPTRLSALYADGATVIMPQLHLRLPRLADLCRAMEREFSSRFQTNIYLTPPGDSQGFKTHFDNHDVFVLQIAGTKAWKIYDTPEALPHRGTDFDPERYTPGDVTQEFELRPGDIAYVPRGVMHDAVSGREASLHITLGVMTRTWTDLTLEALSAASLRDVAFRRSLPPGFAGPDFDRAGVRRTFEDLLDRLRSIADLDGALDHFIDDIVGTRHFLAWDQMTQVERLNGLGLDSLASARPNLLYRLGTDGEGVQLTCCGRKLTLPEHAAEPLRFALDQQRFAVRDLPGELDDDGKLVLVRRLVREGLLMLH